MINMATLQLTSCVRCKSSILGNPKEHLATCDQLARLDEALEELYGDGYDSLSFEQIGLLVEFLLKTDLSGYIMADVVKDVQELELVRVMCPSCNEMIDVYSEHNCVVGVLS